jgi:hypothetical protein
MQSIVRHFIARRLGRGVIKTRFAPDGSVLIEVNYEIPKTEKKTINLLVPRDSVKIFELIDEKLLYRLSRQAISQCQKQVFNAKLNHTSITLDCSLLPWNGDLTILPYAGATTGCSAPSLLKTGTKLRRRALFNLLS